MIIHALTAQLLDVHLQHQWLMIPSVPPGAPETQDYNVPASDGGIKKLNIWITLASIIKYVGYGLTFLAFLCGIVVWGFGHYFLGQHATTSAKQVIIRAGAAAVFLGLAGTIWSWLIS